MVNDGGIGELLAPEALYPLGRALCPRHPGRQTDARLPPFRLQQSGARFGKHRRGPDPARGNRSVLPQPPDPLRHLCSASSQAARGCRSGTQASPDFPSDERASGETTTSSSAGRCASARAMAP